MKILFFKIILTLAFYGLTGYLYRYSKGRCKVKEKNREKYLQWVEEKGERGAKTIRTLVIIYSILLILTLFGW